MSEYSWWWRCRNCRARGDGMGAQHWQTRQELGLSCNFYHIQLKRAHTNPFGPM